ncbi:hypothetical protein [Pseudoalteromonas prydzensis]|uniref:hypothetical protein n=1 Tax=Pseudoalteromonas prydzensis TaxID=182141 RepID=UPI003FCF62E5
MKDTTGLHAHFNTASHILLAISNKAVETIDASNAECENQKLLAWQLVPALVLKAFSIELALKELIKKCTENTDPIKTHSLKALYMKLPADIQQRIVGLVSLNRAEFESVLADHSHTFVEWRYLDSDDISSANVDFLTKFSSAVRNELERAV